MNDISITSSERSSLYDRKALFKQLLPILFPEDSDHSPMQALFAPLLSGEMTYEEHREYLKACFHEQ